MRYPIIRAIPSHGSRARADERYEDSRAKTNTDHNEKSVEKKGLPTSLRRRNVPVNYTTSRQLVQTLTCYRYQQWLETRPNHRHCRTVFEGNKKGEVSSARPTTTFKNWSTEVTTHLCSEGPRLQEILDNRKTQVPAVLNETYIDDRLSEEGLHYEEGIKRAQHKHAAVLSERNAEKDRVIKEIVLLQQRRVSQETHKKILYQMTDQSGNTLSFFCRERIQK
eukprot:2892697-Amphidinium_carterae.2